MFWEKGRVEKGRAHTGNVVVGSNTLITYHDHLSHVTFRSGVFSWVFNLHQDEEVQIMPHIVF